MVVIIITCTSTHSHHDVTADNCMIGCLMMLYASFNNQTPLMRFDGSNLWSERVVWARRKESDVSAILIVIRYASKLLRWFCYCYVSIDGYYWQEASAGWRLTDEELWRCSTDWVADEIEIDEEVLDHAATQKDISWRRIRHLWHAGTDRDLFGNSVNSITTCYSLPAMSNV